LRERNREIEVLLRSKFFKHEKVKIKKLGLAIITLVLATGCYAPGMMGQGSYQGWYCPFGGGYMGPGGAYGMNPWVMGTGYGHRYQQSNRHLEENDAKEILENYLKSTRNPNLKLGEIKDKGTVFEAEIVTMENSLVDKLLVDKNTGWLRSIY
jgi:hypothetical protein